jgi:hypothetical protein
MSPVFAERCFTSFSMTAVGKRLIGEILRSLRSLRMTPQQFFDTLLDHFRRDSFTLKRGSDLRV